MFVAVERGGEARAGLIASHTKEAIGGARQPAIVQSRLRWGEAGRVSGVRSDRSTKFGARYVNLIVPRQSNC